ncbi:MAG: sulfotransferase, partial [Rhodospirillales bacterium]
MASPTTTASLLDEGMRLHQAGHFGDAELAYLHLLRAEPDHSQALNLLGVLYLTGERPKDAVKWLGRRLKRAPDDDLARLNLGKALLASGDAFKAAQTLRPLCDANPHHVDAVVCLARAEQKRGRMADAETLLKELAELVPDNPTVVTELANHHIATGEPAVAEKLFRQILGLQPEDINNHCNLAATLQSMHHTGEAAEVLGQALALDPENYRTRFLLAMNTGLKGEFASAATEMAALVAERPDNIPAQVHLAEILSLDSRSEEAGAHLAALIDSGVDDPDIWHMYGVVCLQLGLTKKAVSAHRRSLRLNPEFATGWRHLAALKTFTDRDPDLTRMLEISKRRTLTSGSQMHLDFAIAKAFDDLRRPARAFAYLGSANKANRATFYFDIDAHEDLVDRLIAATADPVPPPSATVAGPIFIVGMPRSGTTLAEQILASHPEVAAGGELMVLRNAVTEAAPDYPESLAPDQAERIARIYKEQTRRYYGGADWLTDKLPENSLRCGLIAQAFPTARIIHCNRDPLDIG